MGMIALGVLGTSCSSDDGPATATMELDTFGLEELTDGSRYQGWLVSDGEVIPTTKFTNADEQIFTFEASKLEAATEFILTIEQASDNNNTPSDTRILKGTFSGNAATLSFEEAVTSFTGNAGTFEMATPTDNDETNEASGIWFTESTQGLTLNTLRAGWKYEAWAVVNGTPISMGTFTDPSGPDEFNSSSSTINAAPQYPGEDFLNNNVAPTGLVFPLDLRGATISISVEPFPDEDRAPFFLTPLTGTIQSTDAPGDLLLMSVNSAIPQGQVVR
ncbi:hypothetical protein GCM10022393_17650 [Aquimarina addita]|uniref:Anti-sigma factor n=2 Tax=Aquimarina addita TaxID=870485 RepID=A0ABP6UIB2_9FLAO